MYVALENQKEVAAAQQKLLNELNSVLPIVTSKITIGFQSGNFAVDNLRSNGQIWYIHNVYNDFSVPKYWNAFGLSKDLRLTGSNSIAAEVNVPLEGASGLVAGQFVIDSESNNLMLVHSGKIGGGRKGIGKSAFLAWYEGRKIKYSTTKNRNSQRDAIVIADFGKGNVVETIQEFVFAVEVFKKHSESDRQDNDLTDNELLAKARKANKRPKATNTVGTTYERNKYIALYAKRRANGVCDLCKKAAPFISKGKPYLEAHHIKWLAHGGDDRIENSVALCPNCHRKMHIVNSASDVEALIVRAKIII